MPPQISSWVAPDTSGGNRIAKHLSAGLKGLEGDVQGSPLLDPAHNPQQFGSRNYGQGRSPIQERHAAPVGGGSDWNQWWPSWRIAC